MSLLPRTLLIPPSISLHSSADGYVHFAKRIESAVKQLSSFQEAQRNTRVEEQAKQLLDELRMKRKTFQQQLVGHIQSAIRNLIELEKRTYIEKYIDTGQFPSDSLFSMKNSYMRRHYYKAACRRLLEYGGHIEDKTAAVKEMEHANKIKWFNQFYHAELHWSEPAIEPEPCTRVSIKISAATWNYLKLLAAYLNISRQEFIRLLLKFELQCRKQSYSEQVARNFKMIFSYHAISHQKIGTLPPSLNPFNIEQAQLILDNIYPRHTHYREPEPLGKFIYSLFSHAVREPFKRRNKYKEQRFLRIVGVPYNDTAPPFDHAYASLHDL